MTFRVIYEMAVPRTPDLKKIRKQIDVFGPVVDAIFVPDNHLGLPAMSSIVVALEVQRKGFDVIVGLNARDRNEFRFTSDLVTLKAYGLDEVMFLYGDPVKEGRSSLTVERMLNEEAAVGFSKGAVARVGKPLGWRAAADFFMTQIDFGRTDAGDWKRSTQIRQPLYCGVIALRDEAMARRVIERIPELTVPDGFLDRFSSDGDFGLHAALDEVAELKACGVDGCQIVVPSGWRKFVDLMEARL